MLLFRGDGGYTVTAEFINAGQLVKGNEVKAGGVAVGSVKSIDVTQDGHAKVKFSIKDGDYKPLRRGTQVMIKQASLSGIANRYVDLKLGPANGDEIHGRRHDRPGPDRPPRSSSTRSSTSSTRAPARASRTSSRAPPRCCTARARSCAAASTT